MVVRELLGRLNLMTRKGVRRLAEKAESEGWHVVEQVRVDDQPVDLVISKCVVVLVRVSAVPITESARSDFEAAAEHLGCVGLMLDMDVSALCWTPLGRVMVAWPTATERLLTGELRMGDLLRTLGLGL